MVTMRDGIRRGAVALGCTAILSATSAGMGPPAGADPNAEIPVPGPPPTVP